MINENTPTLETSRLILRKFNKMDLQDLFTILSDTQVNTFLPWFRVKNLEEARVFLSQRFLDYYDKPSCYRYAICLKTDNRPIGYLCLSDNESCDLGYGLEKKLWHTGIVTEAAAAVVERIKNAGYSYITATHDINNPHSGGVMKKLGMQYKYSYVEKVQPKNVTVTFRLYQLNFDKNNHETYMEYWNKHENHFIENEV